MAALEDLEIVVNVDIGKAVDNLKDLKKKLRQVSRKIERVDRRGAQGIDIRTHIDMPYDELSDLSLLIRGWEMSDGTIDIDTNVDKNGLLKSMSRTGATGAMGAAGAAMGGARAPSVFGALSGGGGLMKTMGSLKEAFSALSENSAITNINMSDMHNVMARMIPLLIVFVGALPVAITAMVGLATAAIAAAASLAAIAGFGALGFALVDGQFEGEKLKDAFEDIRDSFIEAFAPLAEALQPTFERALAGLETFFHAVGQEGDALVALTDEARAFGGFMIDFFPDALRTLASVVNGLAGIFGNIGRWLEDNFTNAMRSMVKLTAEAMPTFAEFVQIILGAIGPITRLSLGFMRVVNVIMAVIGAIGSFVNWLGISWETIGVVIGTLLSLISVVALASTIIGSVLVKSLIGAIVGMYQYALAAQRANVSLLALAGNGIIAAVGSLYNFILAVFSGEKALWGYITSVMGANAAMAAFITLASLGALVGIVALAGAAAKRFMDLGSSIDGATSSLEDFNSVQNGMDGAGFGGSGGSPYGYSPEGGSGGTKGGGSGSTTVFNVESSGNPDEDRSNLDQADWMSGRTTGGGR